MEVKDRQTPYSTKLPTSTLDKLEELSLTSGKPKNHIVNEALLEYFSKPQSKKNIGQDLFTEVAEEIIPGQKKK